MAPFKIFDSWEFASKHLSYIHSR